MRFHGQHILVIGLGKSGIAALNLLRPYAHKLTCTDSRPLSDLPFAQTIVENSEISYLPLSGVNLASIDTLVVSPGVPLSLPLLQDALARSIPVLGEVELAFEFLRGPILAGTGANGKTTTISLTGHILHSAGIACQVGGNIGLPVTDMVATATFLQWNVLELSSFQLETVSRFHAQIAAILNITPNHLDRHLTLEAYTAAKLNIFRNQTAADCAVLNARSTHPVPSSARNYFFNGDAAHLNGSNIELFGQTLMSTSDVPLPGAHNLENVMAAAVMASLAGASHSSIATAIASFKGVPHRLEFVREVRGIRFYNDSKATSVDATLKAIEALPAPLWVILGGTDKGGSYLPLLPLLQAKAKGVLLIGAATPLIEKELGGKLPLSACGTLSAALHHAVAQATPGDTVLLAPACASFDQFTSYEHRGDSFRQLVEAL